MALLRCRRRPPAVADRLRARAAGVSRGLRSARLRHDHRGAYGRHGTKARASGARAPGRPGGGRLDARPSQLAQRRRGLAAPQGPAARPPGRFALRAGRSARHAGRAGLVAQGDRRVRQRPAQHGTQPPSARERSATPQDRAGAAPRRRAGGAVVTVVDLHPEELLEKDALGQLDEAERARLDSHLSHCSICRFERQLRADFSEDLAADVPPIRFDGLVAHEAARVGEGEDEASPLSRRRSMWPRRRTRLTWLLAAAALLVGGAAAATGLNRPWHRTLEAPPVAPLSEPGTAKKA